MNHDQLITMIPVGQNEDAVVDDKVFVFLFFYFVAVDLHDTHNSNVHRLRMAFCVLVSTCTEICLI